MTTKIPGTFDGKIRQQNPKIRIIGGLSLIALGIYALVVLYVDLPTLALLVMPLVGVLLLLFGAIRRSGALMIPGGMILGLGIGIALTGTVLGPDLLQVNPRMGILLISFGIGSILVTILSLLFARKTVWWTLIVGLVALILGGVLLFNDSAILGAIGRFWPILLIIVGVVVVTRRRK